MSDMVPFFYGDFEIRTVVIDGDGLLVAPDVAKLLELRDTSSALKMVDSEDKMTLRRSEGPHFPRGMDARVHEVTVVNESGFYAMVFQSNKPEAKRVRRWVTGTVLPEIRRTGSFQPRQEIDLEDTDVALDKIIELASIAKGERAGRLKAEARLEVEQRHRQAIEGGDGIDPTTFGKKYFGDVPARQFDKHLYEHDYLIDQRKTRRSSNGEMKDGYDHRKPTANGRKYFYPHDGGTHGGRRRFNPRVRPQMEIALRDALIAEGLPANTHSTGLVLISNTEMQELGA